MCGKTYRGGCAIEAGDSVNYKVDLIWTAVSVAGACVAGVLAAAPAQAESIERCSAAYHTALGELHAAKGGDLGTAFAALRAPDATLPGRWVYSQALLAKPGAKPRVAEIPRVCLESTKVAGRIRCTRFDEAAPVAVPSELTITPAPSADELRVLKALHDLVGGRGAVPEVGNNGRYTWLTQRATGDLRTYMTQPPHPALCSGGKDFAEFYALSLKLLQKRIDDVSELSKKARAQAFVRVTEVVTAANKGDDAAAAPKTEIALPAPTATLLALISDAIQPAVPTAALIEIRNETSVTAALQRAKPALIAAQVEAQSGDDAKARDRVMASARAVRMIEAAAYGEVYVERYRTFTASVLSVPQDIQKTHARTCTCDN